MEDRYKLFYLGITMLWMCRLLALKDVLLFGIFGVRFYYAGGISNLFFSLAFLGMSIFFLVLSVKMKKKVEVLKEKLY